MLRSMQDLKGYTIGATDGPIGQVTDFYFDDDRWVIRYLVVDTSNWWLGHQVLMPPQWVTGIDWPTREVAVHLERDAVKFAPPYDPDVPLDREKETAIYRHYGRPVYWTDSGVLQASVAT